MEIIQTLCGGCAQSDCGMDVHVNQGKIVKITGTKGHAYNNGNLCGKGLAASQLISSPDRVQTPLRRTGERGEGKWAKISWDEALDEIASNINRLKNEYGPECIGLTRGTGPGWEGSMIYHQLFMNALGSGNLGCQGYCCKFPRIVATGTMMGGEPDLDIENSKYILLWASNPADTSLPNYWSRISRAKANGTKIVVIDPRFSRSASKADLYVRIRPGTDGALALGLAHIIIEENLHDKDFVENYAHGFQEYAELVKAYPPDRVSEITEIPQDVIREVAIAYAKTKPALLFMGNGVEQLTNSMQTIHAIYSLPGLTGNIGVKGGHILTTPLALPDLAQKSKFFGGLLDQSVSRHPFFMSKIGGGASINISDIYEAILTGEPHPIRALLIVGSSFLTVIPEGKKYKELLKKNLELIVVHDLFMTKEAKELADIVLPATSFLESWRLRYMRPGFKGNAYIQWVGLQRPVVDPVGESRSDEEFLAGLGHRVGIGEAFPWKDALEFADAMVTPLGLSAEELVKNPAGHLWQVPEEEAIGFYKTKGFNTPSKKFEFLNTSFEKAGFAALPIYTEPAVSPISKPDTYKEYPLILNIGIKSNLFCHTQYHNLPVLHKLMPEPLVEIHPETAAALGIEDYDIVKVKTPGGETSLKAKITLHVVEPNIVYMPYGWSEFDINSLSEHYPADPISGAPSNHALLCQIEKV